MSMRRPGGFLVCTEPGGTSTTDTFSCQHCNTIVAVPVRARPEDIGGMCQKCWQLICPRCVRIGGCTPLEKMIEQMERQGQETDRRRREYGLQG